MNTRCEPEIDRQARDSASPSLFIDWMETEGCIACTRLTW